MTRPTVNEVQPVLVHSVARQPIHPAALLRQSKARWFSSAALRRFMSTSSSNVSKCRADRSSFPVSSVATAVGRITTRTPWSSTLRPNLTGGALPRSAGGYGAGSVRYFSHTPAAPAQVVNNVSMAVRAFWLSGQKAQYDGMTSAGEKRYRSVSTLQSDSCKKMQSTPKRSPGSFIDFYVSPTVTALSPLGSKTLDQEGQYLNTDGLLDVLSVDFARALKDLAAVMNDLKRLQALGDLPISMKEPSLIRVRFPGCDAETVERLCDEVGVQRGIIKQDDDFDATYGGKIALLFPYAPVSVHEPSLPEASLCSQSGHESEESELDIIENPWASPEGYESLDDASSYISHYFEPSNATFYSPKQDYEGLEGIYRFIEECDNAHRL